MDHCDGESRHACPPQQVVGEPVEPSNRALDLAGRNRHGRLLGWRLLRRCRARQGKHDNRDQSSRESADHQNPNFCTLVLAREAGQRRRLVDVHRSKS